MCAAVLGQCGPRMPRLKSLFHSPRYPDEISFLRGDRQAELQSIWQEIGEDKYQKLEELRQTVGAAVDRIYEKALEECFRRKMALEEMVIKSEIRLKEILGSNALQAIAPRELPLQARLSVNMARLHDLDNARVGGYGWVGGLVVLVELRHRVGALREMLKLPPCDGSADLDEVLASTTEALHNLCPGKVTSIPSFLASKSERKPIFQRLQGFYQTLCAMENVWVESFAAKDAEKNDDYLHSPEVSARLRLQELEGMKDTRRRNFDCSSPTIHIAPFGCTTKRSSSKFGYKGRDARQIKQCSEEASMLEELSHKILKKLEEINRQVKCAAQSSDLFSPFSSHLQSPDIDYSLSSRSTSNSEGLKSFSTPLQSSSVSPSSDDNGAYTPTSVLPDIAPNTSSPSYHLSKGINPSLWPTSALVCNTAIPPSRNSNHCQDQSAALDACWALQAANDFKKSEAKDEHALATTQSFSKNANGNESSDLLSVDIKNDAGMKGCESVMGHPNERWPLTSITNNHKSPSLLARKTAPAPHAPPPPPPPPPPPLRGKTAQQGKSAKLKRSATMSRLYMGMKKKVEGSISAQSPIADAALPRRSIVGASNREGMAEALAEITRRSSYFRKIEDDVQQYATSIQEMKSGLESFETYDMQKLLRFHESIEARLEQLTDESQVLARFEGFPVKKLETVRAAASLYLRLSSLIQQVENWPVEPPMSEQLEKVTGFFDKVKTDVEAIERTKDEDLQRFTSQKIHFNFEIIPRIKEAVVDLSSRCLTLALKDSNRTKASLTIDDDYISLKDMNKLRISFQILWKAFQLAFRVHNFAGGHDDKAEQLASDLAHEMDTYPSSFWLELVNK